MKTFQEKIDELVDEEIEQLIGYAINKEGLIQHITHKFAVSLDRLSVRLDSRTRFQTDHQRALNILFKEG